MVTSNSRRNDRVVGSHVPDLEHRISRLIGCKYCQQTDIVKYGTYKGQQRYFCNSCKRKFSDTNALPYQRFPPEQVGTAISLFYRGLSLKKAGEQVGQDYNVPPPNKSTVFRWTVAYTKEALKDIGRPKLKTGNAWVADEMMTSIDGRKHWVWTVMDADSRAILSTHISRTRTTRDAEALFKRAKESAENPPKRIITDSLAAYQDGIERVFGSDSQHTRHNISKGLTSDNNNNLMERLNGTIRERTKVMRGLQGADTARLILDGWTLHYNYFRPHESLDGRTPAEAAGVEIPFKDWPDVARNPFPTHQLTARGIPEGRRYKKRSRYPEIFRKAARPSGVRLGCDSWEDETATIRHMGVRNSMGLRRPFQSDFRSNDCSGPVSP